MRRWLLLIGFFATAVVLLFTLRPTATRKDSMRSAAENETSTSLSPLAPSAAVPSPRQEDDRARREQARSLNIRQTIEGTNLPINFWGKVTDEDGGAIEAVKVSFTYSVEAGNVSGVAWGQQQIHKSETLSDINGVFWITGFKGHQLTVESLSKDGYRDNGRGTRTFNFHWSASAGPFVPDQRKPIPFIMTSRKVSQQPLVTYRKLVELPADGTPVRWSLWKGGLDIAGELQLTLKRNPPVITQLGQPSTYSAKVEMLNGGGIVVAAAEESLYRAPENGYFPAVEYPQAQQRRGVPERSFYVKGSDGRYGRVELRLYADDEGATGRCYIGVVLNPSGSVFLEPGPSPTGLSR